MEIHSPDIIGNLALNGDAGAIDQVVVSAGAGNQALYKNVAALLPVTTNTVTYNATTGVFTSTVNGITGTTTVLTGISTTAGNLLVLGGDGKPYVDVEAVQDAIGFAIAAGVGITYNDALNAISAAVASLLVSNSITGAGTVASPLNLVGDVATPANNAVYGTSGTGVRGWQSNVSHRFQATFASNTTFAVTHNLNNASPQVTVWRTDVSPAQVIVPASTQATSVNVTTVTLALARPVIIEVQG